MMDKKIKEMSGKKDLEDMNLEELDELEDEEDERILMEYRNQRLAEMKALQERSKYGEVKEITAPEYVKEVSGASLIMNLQKSCNGACTTSGEMEEAFLH